MIYIYNYKSAKKRLKTLYHFDIVFLLILILYKQAIDIKGKRWAT